MSLLAITKYTVQNKKIKLFIGVLVMNFPSWVFIFIIIYKYTYKYITI